MEAPRSDGLSISEPLDMPAYLFHVDQIVDAIYRNPDVLPDIRQPMIAMDLVILAYTQGSVVAAQETPNWEQLSAKDRIRAMIKYATDRWRITADYCRDNMAIELHPAFLLEFLQQLCGSMSKDDSYGTKARYVIMGEVIAEEIQRLQKEAMEVIQSLKSRQEAAPGDASKPPEGKGNLLAEYIDLMQKIGTFHADWAEYETPEQLGYHNRILEIYKELTG